jgi:hypothetical protein
MIQAIEATKLCLYSALLNIALFLKVKFIDKLYGENCYIMISADVNNKVDDPKITYFYMWRQLCLFSFSLIENSISFINKAQL